VQQVRRDAVQPGPHADAGPRDEARALAEGDQERLGRELIRHVGSCAAVQVAMHGSEVAVEHGGERMRQLQRSLHVARILVVSVDLHPRQPY